MTRQEANREILNIISQYNEDYPDMRFHQILFNLNLEQMFITEAGEYAWKDLHHLESVKALARIAEEANEEPLTNKDKDENGKIIPLAKRSSIDFRTIVCYDERMEEIDEYELEDLDEKGITDYEGWLKYYELTGDIFIMKSPDWGIEHRSNIEYHFMCGPSIGDECVSDTIYIDWYIEQVAERAGHKNTVATQLAENYHAFDTDDGEEAEKVYGALIEGFKKDGFNVIEK